MSDLKDAHRRTASTLMRADVDNIGALDNHQRLEDLIVYIRCSGLICDKRKRFSEFSNVIKGNKLVEYLVAHPEVLKEPGAKKEADNAAPTQEQMEAQAVAVGERLRDARLLAHVLGNVTFQNDKLLYRLTGDESDVLKAPTKVWTYIEDRFSNLNINPTDKALSVRSGATEDSYTTEDQPDVDGGEVLLRGAHKLHRLHLAVCNSDNTLYVLESGKSFKRTETEMKHRAQVSVLAEAAKEKDASIMLSLGDAQESCKKYLRIYDQILALPSWGSLLHKVYFEVAKRAAAKMMEDGEHDTAAWTLKRILEDYVASAPYRLLASYSLKGATYSMTQSIILQADLSRELQKEWKMQPAEVKEEKTSTPQQIKVYKLHIHTGEHGAAESMTYVFRTSEERFRWVSRFSRAGVTYDPVEELLHANVIPSTATDKDRVIPIETTMVTPQFRHAFQLFAERNHAGESLYFLNAVEAYKRIRDANVRAEKTKLIVQNFIHEDAPYHVNLSDNIRKAIEKATLSNSSDVKLFDDAIDQIHHMLKTDIYRRFVGSDEYSRMVGKSTGWFSRKKTVAPSGLGQSDSQTHLHGNADDGAVYNRRLSCSILPYEEDPKDLETIASALRDSGLLCERSQKMKKYKNVMVAQTMVDWMIQNEYASNRTAGVAVCQTLVDAFFIKPVAANSSEDFKDNNDLYTINEWAFETLPNPSGTAPSQTLPAASVAVASAEMFSPLLLRSVHLIPYQVVLLKQDKRHTLCLYRSNESTRVSSALSVSSDTTAEFHTHSRHTDVTYIKLENKQSNADERALTFRVEAGYVQAWKTAFENAGAKVKSLSENDS